jgi:hypothetical protein
MGGQYDAGMAPRAASLTNRPDVISQSHETDIRLVVTIAPVQGWIPV